MLEKDTHYCLYYASQDKWIDDNLEISGYGLSNASTATEDFLFIPQFKPISITIRRTKTEMEFIVGPQTTVADLLTAVSLHEAASEEDAYGLFALSGERLKIEDTIWSFLKDSPDSSVVFRPLTKRLRFQCDFDRDEAIELEIDTTRLTNSVIVFLCRKLGLRVRELAGFAQSGLDVYNLDRTARPLEELRLIPDITIVLKTTRSKANDVRWLFWAMPLTHNANSNPCV